MLMGSLTPDAAASNGHAAVTWASADPCRNALNDTDSTPDVLGRRWGWEGGVTCAYKDAAGQPRYTFSTAPRCSDLTQASSPPDAEGHIWSSAYTCAFKSLTNLPLTSWESAPL